MVNLLVLSNLIDRCSTGPVRVPPDILGAVTEWFSRPHGKVKESETVNSTLKVKLVKHSTSKFTYYSAHSNAPVVENYLRMDHRPKCKNTKL